MYQTDIIRVENKRRFIHITYLDILEFELSGLKIF